MKSSNRADIQLQLTLGNLNFDIMNLPLIRTEFVHPFQVFWTQPCNTNELHKGSYVVRFASHVTHITETSFPTTKINKHCNFVINLRLLDASTTGAKIWTEIYQLIIPVLQQLCFCKNPHIYKFQSSSETVEHMCIAL